MTIETVWAERSCVVPDKEYAALEETHGLWKLTIENDGRDMSIILCEESIGRLAHHITAHFIDRQIQEAEE